MDSVNSRVSIGESEPGPVIKDTAGLKFGCFSRFGRCPDSIYFSTRNSSPVLLISELNSTWRRCGAKIGRVIFHSCGIWPHTKVVLESCSLHFEFVTAELLFFSKPGSLCTFRHPYRISSSARSAPSAWLPWCKPPYSLCDKSIMAL